MTLLLPLKSLTPNNSQVTKLVYNARTERRFSGFKFPLKLRPQEDELLSSWLIRLALLHRTMPSTFTNLYLPETKNKLWSADFDLQADLTVISMISEKSNISVEVLQDMTLRSFEGYLFEEIYRKTGGTTFVNPLGMRGRKSTLPGLRYCPLCFKEDEHPYFRKQWRLTISVVCLKHKCFLSGCCSFCRTPISPYLSCREGYIGNCYRCGENFVADDTDLVMADADLLEIAQYLHTVLEDGYVLIGDKPVYSHLYFIVFYQLLKLLISRKYGPQLCAGVGLEWPPICGNRIFKTALPEDQAIMLVKVAWLLDEWPDRLIRVCERQRLLSSALLRGMENKVPFWYREVVIRTLYRPDRTVSEDEIRAAIRYMQSKDMIISELTLSRLLGVHQLFRKRELKLKDFLVENK